MEFKDLLEQLSDPYLIQSLGSKGYELLVAHSLGRHDLNRYSGVQDFIKNKESLIEYSQKDYFSGTYERIQLSNEAVEFNDSLSDLLLSRKSSYAFSEKTITFAQLSFFLQLSFGFKAKNIDPHNPGPRMYPSGGALYTTRIYVAVNKVEGLPKGVYLFNPFLKSLDLVNRDLTDELRFKLHNRSEKLETFSISNFEILVTTQPLLSLRKYGEHAWKIILIEIGHLAQNAWLVGEGCGLSMYPCTSLNLREAEKLLRISLRYEILIYSLVIGIAKKD